MKLQLDEQQMQINALKSEQEVRSASSMTTSTSDRRLLGQVGRAVRLAWLFLIFTSFSQFDSRFHSTSASATPRDHRILPDRIFLVRHAESEGNVDSSSYVTVPDSQVPLTDKGHMQARQAGDKIKRYIEKNSSASDYKLFFYTSPYRRSIQTYEGISSCFSPTNIKGVQEEVQIREQDFGNFQDLEGKQREKNDRLRFGRFFYRFPNGESGADVYDRITIYEDHLIRDINGGRFSEGKTNMVIVTHGLALRIFLMRWFHWTLAEYLLVHNPPNAEPLVLERIPCETDADQSFLHTKSLYRLSNESMLCLRGCTADMCSTGLMPRAEAKLNLQN